MIRKETREVFITRDGKEFESAEVALKYEIKCTLDDAPGLHLQIYQVNPAIEALLRDFTITPINPETKEI